MRILVTGGAGFIGSHLVEQLLKDGHYVIVVDNSEENIRRNLDNLLHKENLEVHNLNVNNIKNLRIERVEKIIHLAALADIVPSVENPVDYHEANVSGTLAVLEFAKLHNVDKFIYAASGSCYGDNPPLPTKETDQIKPQYPYALTKYIGEQYALHWHKVYKLPVISLRFFNVYGPRSRTTGAYGAVFGVFLAQIINNKPFTVVGDGYQSRDFVFVTDVVKAIILAMNSDKVGEVYNIGMGNHATINRLVSLLRPSNGAGHNVEYVPERPGEPKITMANITKAMIDLKFMPSVSFNDGVKNMLDNIQYWKDAPVWTKEKINKATEKWFDLMGKK